MQPHYVCHWWCGRWQTWCILWKRDQIRWRLGVFRTAAFAVTLHSVGRWHLRGFICSSMPGRLCRTSSLHCCLCCYHGYRSPRTTKPCPSWLRSVGGSVCACLHASEFRAFWRCCCGQTLLLSRLCDVFACCQTCCATSVFHCFLAAL